MSQPPALCRACGSWFSAPLSFNLASNIRFSNVQVQCPSCGEMGSVPDGTYDFEAGVVTLVAGPPRTVSDLRQLAAFLDEARVRELTREEIEANIVERFPIFSAIVSVLPHNRTELYAFLIFLVAAIALIVTLAGGQEPDVLIGDLDVDVQNVVDVTISDISKPLP